MGEKIQSKNRSLFSTKFIKSFGYLRIPPLFLTLNNLAMLRLRS
jgi:hypothetical protein